MESFSYPGIQENICKFSLPNGLKCVHIKKSGFRGCFASLCIRFGSAMEKYENEGTMVELPSGTAHFLEHMTISGHEEDVYANFSKMGADINAYTSPDMVCFYFDCSQKQNFYSCLSLLFDTVFHAEFREDAIENERKIILDEYSSYLDDPEYVLCEALMKRILKGNRISAPVIGTGSSIRSIGMQELNDAYHAYFIPSNMVLSTWGDLDISRLRETAISCSPEDNFPALHFDPEFLKCSRQADEISRDNLYSSGISNPIFMIGAAAKLSCEAEEQVAAQAGIQIAFNCLFGSSSEFFYSFYADGSLNAYSPPSAELQLSYLTVTLSGESEKSKIIFEKFKNCIDNCDILISDSDWEKSKRATYGNLIRSLDSREDESITIADGAMNGFDFLNLFEIIQKYKKEDALILIKEFFPSDHFTCITMVPESCEEP